MNRHIADAALHHGLEARMGARLAAGLNERAADLPRDLSERLRIGREQAVLRARQLRVAKAVGATALAGAGAQASGSRGGPARLWLGLAACVPLIVLVGGLVMIQQFITREHVLAAAEIDALLLSDQLPPAAWADPGFRAFLKTPRP